VDLDAFCEAIMMEKKTKSGFGTYCKADESEQAGRKADEDGDWSIAAAANQTEMK
jgi:hypothetical protein